MVLEKKNAFLCKMTFLWNHITISYEAQSAINLNSFTIMNTNPIKNNPSKISTT